MAGAPQDHGRSGILLLDGKRPYDAALTIRQELSIRRVGLRGDRMNPEIAAGRREDQPMRVKIRNLISPYQRVLAHSNNTSNMFRNGASVSIINALESWPNLSLHSQLDHSGGEIKVLKVLAIPVFVLALGLGGQAQADTLVAANQTTLTDLGLFSAGSYTIAATGIVSLASTAGDGQFDVGPDGVPVSPVLVPDYAYFNPNGSAYDIPGGNTTGPGGAGNKLGAVMYTLTAFPTAADFFTIGYGTNVALGSGGHIYALVNDTYYGNNNGSFSVSVTAVPEPATWALLIGGFGLVGGAMRRRQRVSFAYA